MKSRHKIELIMEFRNRGVRSREVLAALEKIPREVFLSDEYHERAYDDFCPPISCGQKMSKPFIVGYVCDRLEVTKRHKVLEIGSGSGYQSAVLSRICRRVYALERHRTLTHEIDDILSSLHIANVTTVFADGLKGWEKQAPFERIVINAALHSVPDILFEQLAEGGILIAPMIFENTTTQRLVKFIKRGDKVEREDLIDVEFDEIVSGLARTV